MDERHYLPHSCDTLIALPPATPNGTIVFGKNSDRPGDEVQEVVYFPASDHPSQSAVECTYIEIKQVEHTHAVILSRPAWLWGAEMGANEHGVVIGNEAVWTHLTGSDGKTESLLGMDYVRLGLERGSSARQALDVVTALLEEHGQAGRCFENPDWAEVTYCNSYIIADRTEGWVLETAGRHWAAKQIKNGVMNISNTLTIGSDITLMSKGIVEYATELELYSPSSKQPFNFTQVFSVDCPVERPMRGSGQYRMTEGRKLLEKLSVDGTFNAQSMFSILRDDESGICCTGGSVSVGSQVSVLHLPSSNPSSPPPPDIHWFTATPNPARSVFKPFFFSPSGQLTLTVSPDLGPTDPARTKPRFRRPVDRTHKLYTAHAAVPPIGGVPDPGLLAAMRDLEQRWVGEVVQQGNSVSKKGMFEECVVQELKLYEKNANL